MLTMRNKRMKMMACWLLLAVTVLPWSRLPAAEWNPRLQGGGAVFVDPDTNRATVTRDGVTTPLWDGTHRMQDGSVLIIRRGTAVPNKAILESRQPRPAEPEEWEDALIVGYSPCEKLVRSVCGWKDECLTAEACNLARQLLDMEHKERETSGNRYLMSYTSGQCLKAVKDEEFFTSCPPQEAVTSE